MTTCLIGAGGHAKVVCDVASKSAILINSFIDPKVESFYALKKMEEHEEPENYFISVGGSSVKELVKRQELYLQYKNFSNPISIISNHAIIGSEVLIGSGTFIAHGAIINSNAKIGENVIINTGAIVEHDATIEDGCHIAPGAIILGGAHIKRMSMIGAGAVILPNQAVIEEFLVPSLTRYKK